MNYRSDGGLYLEMCTYALCAVAVNTLNTSWLQGFQIKQLVVEMWFHNTNSGHWIQSEGLPNTFFLHIIM